MVGVDRRGHLGLVGPQHHLVTVLGEQLAQGRTHGTGPHNCDTLVDHQPMIGHWTG